MNETISLSKEFVISRVFDAPRELVWSATTDPKHLMHWWGPTGMEMVSATVDLRPDGEYRYGLRSPDGQVMWGKWVYREIEAPERLVTLVSFTDEAGNILPHPWVPTWPLQMLTVMTLSEVDGKTTMSISASAFNGTEAENSTFEGSFDSMEEGFNGTFNKLDAHLKSVHEAKN